MKRFILAFIFLIGLFAISCSSPPDKTHQPASTQTEFVQTANQVQADLIYAVDETVVPTPDTPATKWLDENTLTAVFGIVAVVYEFLARKIPTSKTVSIIGNLYKLLNWFVPDKSKNGGTLQIRDKL